MPGEPWTVQKLLEWTTGFFTRKEVDAPRLSAELLLGHVLNLPRIKLYTNYETIVPEKQLADFRALVQRASEHEPVAYLTGKAHFFNMEFEVTRDVLIPRADTETLVENVIQLVRNEPGLETARILDLCTGSGCIATALAKSIKGATVVANDISPAALEVTKRNIERHGLSDRVMPLQGDLYDAIKGTVEGQPFDLIVSNPPYIPSADIARLDKNVRDYEPHLALDGGEDGLMVHRRIIAGAPSRLKPGGRIFLEIQFDQGQKIAELLESSPGLGEVKILKDYSGHQRVVTARRS